ncbi:hypothetical protein SAMN05720354_12923 [Nitrosospira sp. Nsp1]|nr:hypothetical protein SAMN05720354_12923 [Nitrosospira sp. Nsp1]
MWRFCLRIPSYGAARFLLCVDAPAVDVHVRNSSRSKMLMGLGSLSDLKEIGWPVHISPLFGPFPADRITIGLQILKIHPHPATFSLRFFKPDRLLARVYFRPLFGCVGFHG